MGCCSRFHTTWWPDPSDDVIDPDKAFDFQRRLSILKRVIVGLAVLAFMIAAIWLLVKFTSGGNADCVDNSTDTANSTNTPPSLLPEKQALQNVPPESQNGSIVIASIFPHNSDESPGKATEMDQDKNLQSSEEDMPTAILGSSEVVDVNVDIEKVLNGSDIALFEFHSVNNSGSIDNHTNPTPMTTVTSTTNVPKTTTEHPVFLSEIPKSSTNVPKTTTEHPVFLSEIPKSSTNVSKTTTEHPVFLSEIPTSSTNVPKTTTEHLVFFSEIPTLTNTTGHPVSHSEFPTSRSTTPKYHITPLSMTTVESKHSLNNSSPVVVDSLDNASNNSTSHLDGGKSHSHAAKERQEGIMVSSTSKKNDTEEWCTSKESVLECVAISKNFRSVTTFLNRTVKHKTAVEGYIMVKTKKLESTWHPYCSENWTLDMGYKLCNGLGFRQMESLSTIELYELKTRLNIVGKEVSIHKANRYKTKPHDLLVVHGDKTSSSKGPYQTGSDSRNHNCFVGYIKCVSS